MTDPTPNSCPHPATTGRTPWGLLAEILASAKNLIFIAFITAILVSLAFNTAVYSAWRQGKLAHTIEGTLGESHKQNKTKVKIMIEEIKTFKQELASTQGTAASLNQRLQEKNSDADRLWFPAEDVNFEADRSFTGSSKKEK